MIETITSDVPTHVTSDEQVFNLNALLIALDAFEQQVMDTVDKNQLERVVFEEFPKMVLTPYLVYGDKLYATLEIAPELEIFLTHYRFTNILKRLTILNRDTLLELSKNGVYEQDYDIPQEKLYAHYKETKRVLSTAVASTKEQLAQEALKSDAKRKALEKIKRLLANRTNPWQVYSEQFAKLMAQNEAICTNYKKVLTIHDHFQSLIKVLQGMDKQFQNLITFYQDFIAGISDKIVAKETATGVFEIEKNLERAAQMGNVQRSVQLNEDIAAITQQLQLEDLPIASNNGILEVRHLQLSRTVQKWLDYEIYPLLADLYAIEENLKLKMHLRLTGLNKLLSLNKEFPVLELNRVFNILNDELDKAQELSAQINNKIDFKLKEELHITAFYTQEDFLNVPIQTTFEKSQKDALTLMGRFFKKRFQGIKSWYKENTFNTERTPLQQATMCIAERMQFTELGHYDSLFMNRNFIGDLFYIVRRKQEIEFLEAVKQWNASFAKTVLITGSAGSGKSTFLQQTVKRSFKNQIVYLQPHSTSTLDGRKFTTTGNLVDALEEIKRINQVHKSRPVLCIDNLESWCDNEHNILANVRGLLRFIEEESQDIFIAVSCSSLFTSHLNKRFRFVEHFSTILDMSRSSSKEIIKAITIRHDTSHKELVDNTGKVIGANTLSKKIQSLASQSNNNIGAVLQSWAFHTALASENEVIVHDRSLEFVPFFSEAELLILNQVVIYKHTSERILKRITAVDYDLKYKSALRRLIHTKILLRNLDGQLHLNPVISHEVERLFIKNVNA